MTKKPADTVFLKIDIPTHVMAELDQSIDYYGCWKSRAAFFREVVERWLMAWRRRDGSVVCFACEAQRPGRVEPDPENTGWQKVTCLVCGQVSASPVEGESETLNL